MFSYSNYLDALYRPPLEKNNRADFICLDKNEAPFSPFNTIDDLAFISDKLNLNTYPDPYNFYQKLANFCNVDASNLLITYGSEQAIQFIFNVFLDENSEVVYPSPSFAMFDVFSYYSKAKVKHLQFDNTLHLDLEYVLDNITDNTSLFVLANPNNPTGSAFDIFEIEQIAKHCCKTNTIFLLDEAYTHYYDINSVSLISKYDTLIITRTFSKAWGLAGLRVGYAISNSKNIEKLRKLKPIDELTTISMLICSNAIDNADVILNKNIEQVNKWKHTFSVSQINNIEYIDTFGNFILLKSTDYLVYKHALLDNKILPKMDFPDLCMKNCMRFSISNDEIMNKIINVLRSVNG